MHLPYYQVADEVVELVAPGLAALGVCSDEDQAIGRCVRLFKWALGRCPDNAPPSVCDVIRGPSAAALIARGAGHLGDPGHFVDAGCAVEPPIFEKVPGGVRIRGLDRYNAAWGKNHKGEWPAWRSFLVGAGPDPRLKRSESVPKPGSERSDPGPKTGPQTQTQTQEKQNPPLARAPARDLDPQRAMGAAVVPAVVLGAMPDRRAQEPTYAPEAVDLRPAMERLWRERRGSDPGWGSEATFQLAVRPAFDLAKGNTAELLRVFAQALERDEFPRLARLADLAKFWGTYGATRAPTPRARGSPFARATDADKQRPGYEPPLTPEGEIDLEAAMGR